MRPLRFEWDHDKAASNLSKHGVSFEEAVTVFHWRPPFRTPTIRAASIGFSRSGMRRRAGSSSCATRSGGVVFA